MTLLKAARIIKQLGIAGHISWLVNREHVSVREENIAADLDRRVKASFRTGVGPDALRLGLEVCLEAASLYAVACHRRNRRQYGRVMGGRA